MNLRCMGMVLSAPPDRPTGKAGLVSRIRRRNWLHYRHWSNSSKRPTTPNNKRNSVGNGNVIDPPRPPTVARQQSELRTRLKPTELSPTERRTNMLAGANLGSHSSSVQTAPVQPVATPEEAPVREEEEERKEGEEQPDPFRSDGHLFTPQSGPREFEPSILPPAPAAPTDSVGGLSTMDDDVDGDVARSPVDGELDWKWILNLSMHFRDQSDREKFFVTFAETPTLRRRLTVSCDYRDAEEGTLEKELATLRYQRDKSARIYDAIRDSLSDIQFYDTITNLKLQTSDGRLHVHVTEDLHEIIPYPPVAAIAHLRCPKYKESELEFDSHLSGFVYKVKVNGDVFIKKEIPGPDTVDEFLYEINALYALADSNNVIRFGGCVVDEDRRKVKGLLISFASKGALIDIIYHERGRLSWETREKWAKQIVSGLSEVHEAGYVQGDFTLSNIVIDENGDAKIIDINRRGCPVGWEPPEVTAMIDGLQRIGMYIGVKSDIFQLGMVLWGIAHEMDEPEAVTRPLSMGEAPGDVPDYFRDIVEACLSQRPQGRPSAKDLISLFPEHDQPSRPYTDETHYGGGGGSFAALDGGGYFSNDYPAGLGQPYEEASRENGGQSMSGVSRSGGTGGTNGSLLSGKLSRNSNSTYTPFPPRELSDYMTGSRRPLVEETQSNASNSNRPISRDSFEDAPQVIEAAPSEASGEESYIPNNIESVIGLSPTSLPPPPPPPPFVRPPLERYSTANDHFGDGLDWSRYMPAPQPRRLPSPPWESGNARGIPTNEDYAGQDSQRAESPGNSPTSRTSLSPPPLPLPIPTTGPGLAV